MRSAEIILATNSTKGATVRTGQHQRGDGAVRTCAHRAGQAPDWPAVTCLTSAMNWPAALAASSELLPFWRAFR
jgi:hypothetical protein